MPIAKSLVPHSVLAMAAVCVIAVTISSAIALQEVIISMTALLMLNNTTSI
jgi:hypothetical protein